MNWQEEYARADAKAVEAHYTERLIAEEIPTELGPIQVMPANHPFDLLLQGREVEIKIARARRRVREREYYQGLLYDPDKRRRLDGEIVILVCVDREDRLWPYVIPRLMVGNRRTIEVTTHPERYGGQWAPYLGAWEYI